MSTATAAPKTIHRKDYQPSAYLIDTVDLEFDIFDSHTLVKSHVVFHKNPAVNTTQPPLVLTGEHLELVNVALNQQSLAPSDYQLNAETLTLNKVPEKFTLDITTKIYPAKNTALVGLYKSNSLYCTQCEPEGFRTITYFLDRPDVMACYTTKIIADQQQFPVLLSNGNLIEQGTLEHGRHWVKWQDPFKKPSYLFALVAGNLGHIEDHFITQSGRHVTLKIFVDKGEENKCQHAMDALKQAMRWDEEKFGREYDLDIFMIVAVSDFNSGAMENKGLNIFNSKFILANPETATDTDYQFISVIVAHEYFHNWTGNRITCRDWFQLSLKEGLTVFRDQEFTADITARPVKRINDVELLRSLQFPQDSSPMAHSVRPDSYIEINNFYTKTVYEKGAEVIRMMQTLLGKEGFRKGMDLYFERHDGQAVTCDDFAKAMEDANNFDLAQFRLWYSQAGTPHLDVSSTYDAANKSVTLTLTQTTPATPGQSHKEAFHIPVSIGLLNSKGEELPIQLEDDAEIATTKVLNLKSAKQTFKLKNVSEKPVVSWLRNFSAPVKLNTNQSENELLFLLAHDPNEFSRWEASQQLATHIILQCAADYRAQRTMHVSPAFIDGMKTILTNNNLDKVFISLVFCLPSEIALAEIVKIIDVEALHIAREHLKKTLATELQDLFIKTYETNHKPGSYEFNHQQVGERRLRNTALAYLMSLKSNNAIQLAYHQLTSANTMTNSIAALTLLADTDCSQRQEALTYFYDTWQHDTLVLDKWFTAQAISSLPTTLQEVKKLISHPAFNIKNPNKVRALIGSFANNNPINFHASDGAGYHFFADQIITIDQFNPSTAARTLEPLIRWERYDAKRQTLMKAELERLLKQANLSKNVYELVTKGLE